MREEEARLIQEALDRADERMKRYIGNWPITRRPDVRHLFGPMDDDHAARLSSDLLRADRLVDDFTAMASEHTGIACRRDEFELIAFDGEAELGTLVDCGDTDVSFEMWWITLAGRDDPARVLTVTTTCDTWCNRRHDDCKHTLFTAQLDTTDPDVAVATLIEHIQRATERFATIAPDVLNGLQHDDERWPVEPVDPW